MKVSESGLRQWVNPACDTASLVAKLNMAGLEVDAVTPVAGAFSGVIVGKIVAIAPHPDAEKLRVCRVQGHPEGEMQVVCGAANAREGLVIPFATLGAQLPGGIQIKKARLRGVESFGMLCGQTELACGDDDSGLWELPVDAPIGQDLRQYLDLDDQVLELDLTPNRSDCLSLFGVAREVSALTGAPLKPLAIAPVPASAGLPSRGVVLDTPACPHYRGRYLAKLNNRLSSPLWLVQALSRAGIGSKSPIVDVTNFVLIELGQPMHAFDAAKVQGDLVVRPAVAGETLALLNGQKLALAPADTVVADSAQALALAGVMGGQASAVSAETTEILLEAAFFVPRALAGRARHYGLHTDSSHRFERGVDYALPELAIERATALILAICGGEAGPLFGADREADKPKRDPIRLHKSRVSKTLGLEQNPAETVASLRGLGLALLEETDSSWLFGVPSHRFDLHIEADLIEEIARLYGYDKLPVRIPVFADTLPDLPEGRLTLADLTDRLVARGFNEAITYSFVDPACQSLFGPDAVVSLQNPISADMAEMRTSLLPGLAKALAYNLNRQQSRVALFETGLVFSVGEAGTYPQSLRIAAVMAGECEPQSWASPAQPVDFYDIKGHVEALLCDLAAIEPLRFVRPDAAPVYCHPGQTAAIYHGEQFLGWVGALHPSTQAALNLDKTLWFFELALQPVLARSQPKVKPLSHFPAVSRDLALLVPVTQTAARLETVMRALAGDSLKSLRLFDLYQGAGVPDGYKSLAFSLTWQSQDRTLTDEALNPLLDALLAALATECGARLR